MLNPRHPSAHVVRPTYPRHIRDIMRQRLYLKITVSAVTTIFVVGWIMFLSRTLRNDAASRPPIAHNDRAAIIASLQQMRADIGRIPSVRELIDALNQSAPVSQKTLTSLATKIAGQATSTPTTTPMTASTTLPHAP